MYGFFLKIVLKIVLKMLSKCTKKTPVKTRFNILKKQGVSPKSFTFVVRDSNCVRTTPTLYSLFTTNKKSFGRPDKLFIISSFF